nr:MAG TPA: hypothetical protein [Caudoviricetes sp.]
MEPLRWMLPKQPCTCSPGRPLMRKIFFSSMEHVLR